MPRKASKSVMVSVKLPVWIIERIDMLLEKGVFYNRSDVIRAAVIKYVLEVEQVIRGCKEVGYR